MPPLSPAAAGAVVSCPPSSAATAGRRDLVQERLATRAARRRDAAGASGADMEGPLSFAQEAVWFVEQLQPQAAIYNVPQGLRIRGRIDGERLERALQQAVARHPALRSVIELVGGAPRQRVLSSAPAALPIIDVSGLGSVARDQRVAELIRAQASSPFNLAEGPLLRGAMLRLAEDDHILLLTVHHLVCDLWSFTVLFREITVLYAEEDAGRLPPLQATVIDLAREERDLLQTSRGRVLRDYWRAALADAETTLAVPTDHRRGLLQTYRGAVATRLLDTELQRDVKAFALRAGVSPFMYFLTVFAAVLNRYTGQQDILIGTPVSRRSRLALENVVGFLVNPIVVRIRCGDTTTFEQLLMATRTTVLDGLTHQDMPFEKLVEELRLHRDASRHPLFQVVFQYNAGAVLPCLGDATVEPIDVRTPTAKFDLTLSMVETVQGIAATVEYNSDLFEAATAARLLGHIETLTRAALRLPAAPVATLELLTPAETRQLLVEWNDTATPFPGAKTVPALFAEQVARTPQAIAVEYGSESLTYAELDRLSSRWAQILRSLGVQRDVLVGVALVRSPRMIVAWLAVLKAGGAYVPLDAEYPSERLAFMMTDARMPVVITEGAVAHRLPVTVARLVRIDAEPPAVDYAGGKGGPECDADAESLAYVIYTSGSTGEPKGVAVPHRAIARLVFNTPWMKFSAEDRIGQVSNSAFDAATFEVWGALLHGGTLVGLDKETILSPEALEGAIQRLRISAMFLTVALFHRMAAERPAAFRTMKYLLFGGDAADPKWVREVLAKGSPAYLQNGYGPTECTTFAAWHRVEAVPPDAVSIPIGRPIANTTFHVLDRNRQLVPIGVPGELYLGGPGLARGYWNRPELTGERFVRNPFPSDGHDRIYRTGDLVRYLPDGSLEFIGRIDRQVKLRGFRIELEEIETVLGRHEAVRSAVVVVRDDVAEERQLVAYVVVGEGKAPASDGLRTHCQRTLPDYMVPGAFVILDRLPVTANGKIDRRALPKPQSHGSEDVHSGPMMHLEVRLAKLWEEVLGVGRVGLNDNFFALGGHSLLAVSLFARIEKKLGQKLPLSALFQAPTVAALAAMMRRRDWKVAGSTLVEIQPRGTHPPMFWLHTLGGGAGVGLFSYERLAHHLGPEQPSYSFVAPAERFASFEAMAAHYVAELRTVQPAGPYYLGGYCFGGVLAYEMARQLAEAGDEVAMVALIESGPPNPPLQAVRRTFELMVHLARVSPHWVVHTLRQPEARIRRLRNLGRGLGRKAIQAVRSQEGGSHLAVAELDALVNLERYPAEFREAALRNWELLRRYVPKPYDGRLTIYRTRSTNLFTLNVENDWRRLSPDVDVIDVPGTHDDILEEPHVAVVARKLRARLERLHAAQPPAPVGRGQSGNRIDADRIVPTGAVGSR